MKGRDVSRNTPQSALAPAFWLPLLVCLLAVWLCVAQSFYFQVMLDDAYIGFVYARNWVDGHGVVFNVGERVEGYTCFLWVALSAIGLLLGIDIETWSTALGILSAAVAIVAAWQLAHAILPARSRQLAVLAAVLVGGYPPFAWWAASGMETPLFTGLVTLAIWRHMAARAGSVAAPVYVALASMTRPEGCLLAGLLCLDTIRVGTRRETARYVGSFLAFFLPYFAWRWWYYGALLPNTFYAKVGLSSTQLLRGVTYLQGFVVLGGGWLFLIGAASATLLCGIAGRLAVLYLFLLGYLVYVILVGGDGFYFYRFLIPIVPTLGALSVGGTVVWADRLCPTSSVRRLVVTASFVVGFLAVCLPMFRRQQEHLELQRNLVVLGEATCLHLNARLAPDAAIAACGVGRLKFCTGRRVIDMLGLTDAHIAHQHVAGMGAGLAGHEKYDSTYILAQAPAYIVVPKPETVRNLPPDVRAPISNIEAVRDLWRQPGLRRHYVADRFGYRRIDPDTASGK